jgi:hypothetical protein
MGSEQIGQQRWRCWVATTPTDSCSCFQPNLWSFGRASEHSRLYALLNGRTRHRAVRTENTTTSWKRLQCLSAALAVVEGHAGVRWHGFGRLVPTIRTGQSRLKLWLRHAAKCGVGQERFPPRTLGGGKFTHCTLFLTRLTYKGRGTVTWAYLPL